MAQLASHLSSAAASGNATIKLLINLQTLDLSAAAAGSRRSALAAATELNIIKAGQEASAPTPIPPCGRLLAPAPQAEEVTARGASARRRR